MTKKEELQKILRSSFDETINGFPSVVFIDTADQSLAEEIFSAHTEYAQRHSLKTTAAAAAISGRTMRPYYPFLDIIKDRLGGRSHDDIETVLEQASVYTGHRDLFQQYFSEAAELRTEEPIYEEIEFEKKRFRSDILSLLLALAGNSLVIQVSRLENIGPSAAEFILHLQESCTHENVQFIFAMDITGTLENENAPAFLRNFAGEISSVYPVFNIEGRIFVQEPKPDFNAADAGAGAESAIGLLNFLCLEESAEAARLLYDRSSGKTTPQKDENALTALMISALSFLYQREFDTALFYANLFISESRLTEDQLWQSRANRITGMLYYLKGDDDQAARFAHLSLQHAASSGSREEEALAHFTVFTGKDNTSTVFLHPDQFGSLNDTMITLFENAGFTNHLAYIYSRPIYQMFLFRTSREVSALETCNRAISLSSAQGNDFRLAAAYQAQGLLMQALRRNDAALTAFVRAEKIIEQTGSPLEKTQVYNGRGYFYFFIEQYPSALEYYYKALGLLEKTNQHEELCTTLVNVAFTYLFCFKYDECIHYLEETIRIMNYLKINDLPFHPRFFIYCILGIAYIKKQRHSRALELVNRIHTHQRVSIITRHEYYKFLLAEIERFSGNIDAASLLYEETIASAREIEAETKHIILFCYYEYGLMLMSDGQKDLAREVFARALDEAGTASSYEFHTALITAAMEGQPQPELPELPFHHFDSSTTLHFVKLDATLNHLHRKIMEINFLNSLQTVLSSSSDTADIIRKTGNLISSTPIGTACVIATCPPTALQEASPIRCEPACSSPQLSTEKIQLLFETALRDFGAEERLMLQQFRGSEGTALKEIYYTAYIPLSAANIFYGFILVLSEKKEIILTMDDMRTLSIAAKQVTTAIELKLAMVKLMRSASIDSLTGVCNRHELQRKIEIERQRVFRYKNSRKNRFSVLYIDLDNFKYYNDTFGHPTGDAVLKYFIHVLESLVRNIDVIGRLGGDEFIIMLPETPEGNSAALAERILEKLKDHKAFTSAIRSDTGSEIPAEKNLRCSMGIAEYDPKQNITVDTLLSRADKALYEAKNAGKNCYKISL
jgi:diguanylate cyclase (GGDEF)-like protein